ncbi:hypothetical protein BX659_1182 [Orenia metallireducens]|jgi:predicted nucleic acid-binding Zn ribbon protein|uniref:hypothetical protein n=1 Tax=Orenia metallireducens TaxID=1413210 RepID=UPI000D085F63|nr:hypothetical protein [Orenia metallireducens]PRX26891.1 hypothetical protein BX659_1182 [Orenia metallireducens]
MEAFVPLLVLIPLLPFVAIAEYIRLEEKGQNKKIIIFKVLLNILVVVLSVLLLIYLPAEYDKILNMLIIVVVFLKYRAKVKK